MDKAPIDDLPLDWEDPDFEAHNRWSGNHVHEWLKYVSEELQQIWDTFSPKQKQAIARNAQVIADREDWG